MKDFENSKQAEEYVQGLLGDKIPLPEGSSPVEDEVLKSVKSAAARLNAVRNALRDTDNQLQALQARRAQLVRDLDSGAGEASAYAKILVSAEGKRRAANGSNGKVVELPVPAPAQEAS